MAVEVQTDGFEGPFDLLLHLILQNEVDIYEITLVEIVDAFCERISGLVDGSPPAGLDLDSATEFLLIAATLVELKCRRLLPDSEESTLDEELGLWEERDLLLNRLVECKTFKNVADQLVALQELASRSVPRRAGLEDRFADLAPDPLAGVTPIKLAEAFARAVRPRPEPVVETAHIAPIRAFVTDAIAELGRELPGRGPVSFRALTVHCADRIEVVVRFLALLELFKNGLVDLRQTASFSELVVEWSGDEDAAERAVALADVYDG